MTRRPLVLAVVVLLAASAVLGCHRFGGNATVSPDDPAYIYFTNESLDQANVYAAGPGTSTMRIGTVFGGRTDTLMVPQVLVASGASVTIYARIFARSRVVQTGPVSIQPGDAFAVRLTADEKILSVLPAPE